MKRYGLIVADQGSGWYFTGADDTALGRRRPRAAQAGAGQRVRGRRDRADPPPVTPPRRAASSSPGPACWARPSPTTSRAAAPACTVLERDEPGAGATGGSFAWANATYGKEPRAYFELHRLALASGVAWPASWARRSTSRSPGRCSGPPARTRTRCGPRCAGTRGGGARAYELGRDEMLALVPGLEPGAVGAATFTPDEAAPDAVAVAEALLAAAGRTARSCARASRSIALEERRRRRARPDAGGERLSADRAVIACGVDTPGLAAGSASACRSSSRRARWCTRRRSRAGSAPCSWRPRCTCCSARTAAWSWGATSPAATSGSSRPTCSPPRRGAAGAGRRGAGAAHALPARPPGRRPAGARPERRRSRVRGGDAQRRLAGTAAGAAGRDRAAGRGRGRPARALPARAVRVPRRDRPRDDGRRRRGRRRGRRR